MNIIGKLWLGLYPLGRTFWLFYVIGFFTVHAATVGFLFVSRELHAAPIGLIMDTDPNGSHSKINAVAPAAGTRLDLRG